MDWQKAIGLNEKPHTFYTTLRTPLSMGLPKFNKNKIAFKRSTIYLCTDYARRNCTYQPLDAVCAPFPSPTSANLIYFHPTDRFLPIASPKRLNFLFFNKIPERHFSLHK